MRDLDYDNPLEAAPPELGVIGVALFDQLQVPEMAKICKEADFADPECRAIWGAILRHANACTHFDATILGDELADSPAFVARKSGRTALAVMTEAVQRVQHVNHGGEYATKVAQDSSRRMLKALGIDLSRNASDKMIDLQEIVDDAERIIIDVRERQATKRDLNTVINDALEETLSDRPSHVLTHFPEFDRTAGGLPRGGLTMLCGRPGEGKSIGLGSIALNNLREGKSVLFVSAEMSDVDTMVRMFSNFSGLDSKRMQSRGLTGAEKSKLVEESSVLRGMRLKLDGESRTVMEISAEARMYRRQQGLDLLIIDYLQMLESPIRASRHEQVAGITRDLVKLAKSLKIPVLCACAMNRAIEARENKAPRMSDIRDSGAIESDSSLIAFLDRPWLRAPLKHDQSETNVIIAKNRYGDTGEVKWTFDGALQRFTEPPVFKSHGEYFGSQSS